MTPKHFLKRENRSKNKIRKITVKSQNDVKSVYFLHVLGIIITHNWVRIYCVALLHSAHCRSAAVGADLLCCAPAQCTLP